MAGLHRDQTSPAEKNLMDYHICYLGVKPGTSCTEIYEFRSLDHGRPSITKFIYEIIIIYAVALYFFFRNVKEKYNYLNINVI